MLKRATHRETMVAIQRNQAIINKVRKLLRPLGYHFQDEVVGSSKFNTILVDKGNPYDIDVRLILTHNTRETNAERIFIDFHNAFEQIENKNLDINFGTQAIKCMAYNQNIFLYSIEYVIIQNSKIIRLNENQGIHHWHQLKASYESIYNDFEMLSSVEKEHLIQQYILPLKIDARNKNDEKPSVALFIEGYNNFLKDN